MELRVRDKNRVTREGIGAQLVGDEELSPNLAEKRKLVVDFDKSQLTIPHLQPTSPQIIASDPSRSERRGQRGQGQGA